MLFLALLPEFLKRIQLVLASGLGHISARPLGHGKLENRPISLAQVRATVDILTRMFHARMPSAAQQTQSGNGRSYAETCTTRITSKCSSSSLCGSSVDVRTMNLNLALAASLCVSCALNFVRELWAAGYHLVVKHLGLEAFLSLLLWIGIMSNASCR